MVFAALERNKLRQQAAELRQQAAELRQQAAELRQQVETEREKRQAAERLVEDLRKRLAESDDNPRERG